MSTILGVLILTAVASAAAGWLAWKIHGALRVEEAESSWWEHFDPNKYGPLLYLLDGAELEFLRAQRGCSRDLVRKFRAERARICLQFLREMRADFNRLHAVGQALVVANRCSEDFPQELFQHRIRFSLAWWRMRAALLVWRLGWTEPDASALLASMHASASRVRLAVTPAV